MELRAPERIVSLRSPRHGGEVVSRQPGFRWLARAGLVARGAVYGVIGVLAVKLALGSGGKTTNQQGALRTVAQEPFGKGLLIALAVGLAGYAAWRLLRAALGHGGSERDSAFKRVSAGASGLVYAALCVVAVEILVGGGSGGSGSPRSATAGVLGWSGGTVIVAIAGCALAGVGLYQGYKALSRSFLEEADTRSMSDRARSVFTALGVAGHLARMVVFGLVGYGLIAAAIDYEPRKAIGLDGALAELSRSSDGPLLLGIVAAGLVCFALFSIADARYHKL